MLLRFASIPQKPWQPEFYPTLKTSHLKNPIPKVPASLASGHKSLSLYS